jgi:hypothetical protein
MDYNNKTDIEYTGGGGYSCSSLLLELENGYDNFPNIISMDKCAALKNGCNICYDKITTTTTNNNNTNNTNTHMNTNATTHSEVVNNETDASELGC